MTTTPNEPVEDPDVIPSGDPSFDPIDPDEQPEVPDQEPNGPLAVPDAP